MRRKYHSMVKTAELRKEINKELGQQYTQRSAETMGGGTTGGGRYTRREGSGSDEVEVVTNINGPAETASTTNFEQAAEPCLNCSSTESVAESIFDYFYNLE